MRWLGRYEITEFHDNDTMNLTTINGSGTSFLENMHRLRIYHQSVTSGYFYHEFETGKCSLCGQRQPL